MAVDAVAALEVDAVDAVAECVTLAAAGCITVWPLVEPKRFQTFDCAFVPAMFWNLGEIGMTFATDPAALVKLQAVFDGAIGKPLCASVTLCRSPECTCR